MAVIIGVGVDSIEIARVARAAANPRWQQRLFTTREREQIPVGPMAASRMASLFAGKEAVLKAFGTGLRGHSWQQIEVLHQPCGAPYIELSGQAQLTATAQGICRIHISLSHDTERAIAFCIAEGDK